MPTELAMLVTRARRCRRCEASLPLGARPVLQCAPNARILVAGQAPGRRVHASGIPFDDPSGERLRGWMGIDRAQFYDPECIAIVPMGFCYPGSGKSGDLPPPPACAPAWRQALLDLLPRIELTLLLGRYAQAWHLGDTGDSVTERVRQWRTRWPEILPLPHPSPRNNRWLSQHPWFETEVLPGLRERVKYLLQPGNE